jgi:hypothetical protein
MKFGRWLVYTARSDRESMRREVVCWEDGARDAPEEMRRREGRSVAGDDARIWSCSYLYCAYNDEKCVLDLGGATAKEAEFEVEVELILERVSKKLRHV